MIKLAQYENMFSIYLTILVLLPNIILCFFKKKSKYLDLITSLLVIVGILGIDSLQLIEFFLFLLFETVLVMVYCKIRKHSNNKSIYFFVLALSILPILAVRLSAFSSKLTMVVGFTGISYMCFKIWQVIIEIYDGKIEHIQVTDLLLFAFFFPSFSSGPIARYQAFIDSYQNSDLNNYFNDFFVAGIKKLLLGVFYKFALAFFVNRFIIAKIPESISFLNVLIYMYGYTLYLFFDFAGYSNIAIGVGKLMGIALPENFNKPFLACNMKEFWNRWHMSLSSWFNDYVYGRFVLNNVRNGLFKSTKTASRWAYMLTMTLMGLWHGFSVHYLIYGLYEGILLVVTDYWVRSKIFKNFKKKKCYPIVSRVICFQFIAFGMLLFSGRFLFER